MQTNTLWTQVYQSMRDVVRGDLHEDDVIGYPWRSWFLSSASATNRTATFRPDLSASQIIGDGNYGLVFADGFDRTLAGNDSKNFTNEWGRNPYIGWHFRESQLWLERLAPRYGQISGEGTNLTYEPFGTWTNLANIAGLTSNDWRRAVTNYPGMTNTTVLDCEGEYFQGTNSFDPTGRYVYEPNPEFSPFYFSETLPYQFTEFDGNTWILTAIDVGEIATNAAGPFGTYTAADGFSGVGVATETIIRTIPDPEWDEWQYGRSVTGDIIGPWLFEDIAKAADIMRIAHYDATNALDTFIQQTPTFAYPVGIQWYREYTNSWFLGSAKLDVPIIVTDSGVPDLDGLYHDSVIAPAIGHQFFPGATGAIANVDGDWYIYSRHSFIAVDGGGDHPAEGNYDTDERNPHHVISLMSGPWDGARIDHVTNPWALSARRDGAGFEIYHTGAGAFSLSVATSHIAESIGDYLGAYPSSTYYEIESGEWVITRKTGTTNHWYLSDALHTDTLYATSTNAVPDATGTYPINGGDRTSGGFTLRSNDVFGGVWELWEMPERLEIIGDVATVTPSTVIGSYEHQGGNIWASDVNNWVIASRTDNSNRFGIFTQSDYDAGLRHMTNAYFTCDADFFIRSSILFPLSGGIPVAEYESTAISTGQIFGAVAAWKNDTGSGIAGAYTPWTFGTDTTGGVVQAAFGDIAMSVTNIFERISTYPFGVFDPVDGNADTNSIEVIRSGFVRDAIDYWGDYEPIGIFTNTLHASVKYYQRSSHGPVQPTPSETFSPVDDATGNPRILEGALVNTSTNGWEYFDDALLEDAGAFEMIADIDPFDSTVIAARDAAMDGAFAQREYLQTESITPGWRYFGGLTKDITYPDQGAIDWDNYDPADTNIAAYVIVYMAYEELENVSIAMIADRSIMNRNDNYGAGPRNDLPDSTNVLVEMAWQEGHPLHEIGEPRFIREVLSNVEFTETASFLLDPRTDSILAYPNFTNTITGIGPLPVRPVESPIAEINDKLETIRDEGWSASEFVVDDFVYGADVDCPIKRYIIEWSRKYEIAE
jgi:hypothetical protein